MGALSTPMLVGSFFTATADLSGSTSEFAAAASPPMILTPFIVTRTDDGAFVPGGLTLRQAIQMVNANTLPGTPTIGFAIAGGNQVIRPTSPLPVILNAVDIDGSAPSQFPTQTITLDGSQDVGDNGLTFVAGGNTLSGLAIVNYHRDPTVAATNSGVVQGVGVFLQGGNTLIQGDYIGTDRLGTSNEGNELAGLLVFSSGNTIGGTTRAAHNVISGNGFLRIPNPSLPGSGFGLDLPSSGSTNNLVIGNFIGTTPDGESILTNAAGGVAVENATGNTIGAALGTDAQGFSLGANLISANGGPGILLSNSATLVQGNLIGTDAAGTMPLGNQLQGISIAPDDLGSTIGGAGAGQGNRIAFNGDGGTVSGTGAGIGEYFSSPSGTISSAGASAIIRGNLIYGNANLGIDLANVGVTANRPPTTVTDPNRFPNYPVLTSATVSGGNLIVTGTFDGTESTPTTLDFFTNDAADPSGFGEGQFYRGSITFTTDANGHAAFTATLSGTIGASQVITATATSFATSEFSQAIPLSTVPPPPPPPPPMFSLSLAGSPEPVGVADLVTYTLTVTNVGEVAEDVVLEEALPVGLDPISQNGIVNPPPAGSSAFYQVDVGVVQPGQSQTLVVQARPTVAGTLTVFADARIGTTGTPTIVSTSFATHSIFTFNVLNNNDSGFGSLRQAILNADASGTAQAIHFQLPSNQLTIQPVTALPEITVPIVIDATSQAGFAGSPIVTLDGSQHGAASPFHGLVIDAGASTIRGLTIENFPDDGILLKGAGDSTIVGDAILSNGDTGVFLQGSVGNTIGGTASADRNVISGNAFVGVQISSGSSYNLVQGNFIGLDSTGMKPKGNGLDGVLISASSNNTIGGGPPAPAT